MISVFLGPVIGISHYFQSRYYKKPISQKCVLMTCSYLKSVCGMALSTWLQYDSNKRSSPVPLAWFPIISKIHFWRIIVSLWVSELLTGMCDGKLVQKIKWLWIYPHFPKVYDLKMIFVLVCLQSKISETLPKFCSLCSIPSKFFWHFQILTKD